MATAVEPKVTRTLRGEQRVVLRGVGRAGYEALLAMAGDGHVRVTCNGRDVELMSPSRDHDRYSRLICRMIDAVTEELHVPCQSLGTTTWRTRFQEQGLEADECFYLASLDRIRGKRGNLDPGVDPPPDLCVEIEISRGAVDKLAVYAALGVPEVWRFDGETLRVEVLRGGAYEAASESPGLPALHPGEVARWLKQADALDDHSEWARRMRAWVRDELAPRQGRG